MKLQSPKIIISLIVFGLFAHVTRNKLSTAELAIIAVVFMYLVACNFIELYEYDNDTDVAPQARQPEKFTLLFFYSDSCGYCQEFKPEWEKIQAALQGHPIVDVVAIDGASNREMVTNYNVAGFPTLMIQGPDGSIIPYNGQRTQTAVITFVQEVVG